eukprot:CAMPEP_0119133808 /NCGR_PEP_ID=MMETSP1310-20130426/13646_1 /TAXON_ID=464262 /ORGANISM="Genus nov. species nov., Strain RCC2339" /LENGTH=192 /DNA_ID=CAMNT_0007124511 /DNA_START=84 /DNA_END=662 /DNA_ORIENTATION=+
MEGTKVGTLMITIVVAMILLGHCGVSGKQPKHTRDRSMSFAQEARSFPQEARRGRIRGGVNQRNVALDARQSQTCEEFSCPAGQIVVPDETHVSTSNGCGSSGEFNYGAFAGAFDFTECCDKHDHCYDTCGAGKPNCEDEFLSCMQFVCKLYNGEDATRCGRQANIFHGAVLHFGCFAYQNSQQNACMCEDA